MMAKPKIIRGVSFFLVFLCSVFYIYYALISVNNAGTNSKTNAALIKKNRKVVSEGLPESKRLQEGIGNNNDTLHDVSSRSESIQTRQRDSEAVTIKIESHLMREVLGVPGVTEKELAALHEQQMRTIEARLQDPNEIVVPSLESGKPGITRGEIEAIHEQQLQIIAERFQDSKEIIVPHSMSGKEGITRGELLVLHKQQMAEIETRINDPYEVVLPPPSGDEQVEMTGEELKALHEQQMRDIEIRLMDLDKTVSPALGNNTKGIKRWQLLDLHEQQMENMRK